jgi:putative endonuclease
MSLVRAPQFVYVLMNANGQFYTGYTSDIKKRVNEHKDGKSTYTKTHGPYRLIYYETCFNIKDAYAIEKYLKSGMGKRYLRNRMKNYLEL